MSKKDTISKIYMSKNEIFADAVNFYFFDGKQTVRPEHLRELSPEELALPYGKEGQSGQPATFPVQKYRDILKECAIKENNGTIYVIYGIEVQSSVHYAMPVRNMLYDALHYAAQVSEIVSEHRKNRDYGMDTGEFLSGFYRSDRLYPVHTMVIYFGARTWDGPRSLKEMLRLPEKNVFFNDYRLNLLVPAEVEDFGKFHTQLGGVLEFLKVMEDKEELADLIRRKKDFFQELPREAAEVLRAFAKTDIKISGSEEEVDMCRGIDEMMEDVREELIRNFIREGTPYDITRRCVLREGMSEEQFQKIWASERKIAN